MEVETPILSQAAATDPNLGSFFLMGAERARYPHTSPEFAMKRLLAAGSGDIYQICKVFRTDEVGRHHNPEFSLVEWYRLGFDHHTLMNEVEALVNEALAGALVVGPAHRITYREAFMEYAGLDVSDAQTAECAAIAVRHGIQARDDLSLEQWMDLLTAQVVVPAASRKGFTFIYDFPASQAALARIRPAEPPVAERFELLAFGLELANGFHELTDAREQRARFDRELWARRERSMPAAPMDERLLEALAHGLPDCAGVALGLDRLVMLAANVDQVSQAMAFSWANA
jgi:lysyl-tRNA synthetase class 2